MVNQLNKYNNIFKNIDEQYAKLYSDISVESIASTKEKVGNLATQLICKMTENNELDSLIDNAFRVLDEKEKTADLIIKLYTSENANNNANNNAKNNNVSAQQMKQNNYASPIAANVPNFQKVNGSNPIPEKFREKGVIIGQKPISNGFFTAGYLPKVGEYVVDSMALYISQENTSQKPTSIQVIKIDKNHVISVVADVFIDYNTKLACVSGFKETFNSSEEILKFCKKNYDQCGQLSITEKAKPMPENSIFQNSPYFTKAYDSCELYDGRSDLAIFYSKKEECHNLVVNNVCLKLSYESNKFNFMIGNKKIESSDLKGLIGQAQKFFPKA